MAKWQTRQLEGLVPARAWRFESSLRQIRKLPFIVKDERVFFVSVGIFSQKYKEGAREEHKGEEEVKN